MSVIYTFYTIPTTNLCYKPSMTVHFNPISTGYVLFIKIQQPTGPNKRKKLVLSPDVKEPMYMYSIVSLWGIVLPSSRTLPDWATTLFFSLLVKMQIHLFTYNSLWQHQYRKRNQRKETFPTKPYNQADLGNETWALMKHLHYSYCIFMSNFVNLLFITFIINHSTHASSSTYLKRKKAS